MCIFNFFFNNQIPYYQKDGVLRIIFGGTSFNFRPNHKVSQASQFSKGSHKSNNETLSLHRTRHIVLHVLFDFKVRINDYRYSRPSLITPEPVSRGNGFAVLQSRERDRDERNYAEDVGERGSASS